MKDNNMSDFSINENAGNAESGKKMRTEKTEEPEICNGILTRRDEK